MKEKSRIFISLDGYFSLQFHVKDTASLSRWYNETGDDLAHALTEKFKDQVVGFTTLLEIIE